MQAIRLAPAAIIVPATAAMIWWTWGTWPDVLVDFGRELYVPWQLTEGQVLYRDLAWLNGPLAPYLNAFWFEIFGVGIRSLVIGNLALTGILMWLIFRIARDTGGRFAATMATLTFVTLFGFGQFVPVGNYNYVTPYSHDLTHGVVLSFAAMACFSSYLRSRRTVMIAGAGFALGLAFLTKAEVFLACAIALGSGLIAAMRLGVAAPARTIAWFAVSCLAPFVITAGLLSLVLSPAEALAGAAGSWRYVGVAGATSLDIYRNVAGVFDLGASARLTAVSAVAYGALFGAAAAISFFTARLTGDRVARAAIAFSLVIFGFGATAHLIPWKEVARPFSLLMILFSAGIGIRIVRAAGNAQMDRSRLVMQLTLTVFALVLLLRMFFNARLHHYGFALAMPAMLVLVLALFDWLPAALAKRGGDALLFRAVALAAWGVLVVVNLQVASMFLGQKSEWVASGADAFRADLRAGPVNAALDGVSRHVGPGRTLLAVPEGVMLNYLARRESPVAYVNFMPLELLSFGEDRIIEALSKDPPDFVALVHKDTTEYGFTFFGRDYGQRLASWLAGRYRPIETYGAVPFTGRDFGISLLRKIE